MDQSKRLRPGPGWRSFANQAVFQHESGIRIHVYGLAGVEKDVLLNGKLWPESRMLDWFIRVNGGNRRRGVMAWALSRLNTRKG